MLAYFAQEGLHGKEYAEWVLVQAGAVYTQFEAKFLSLWSAAAREGKAGEAYKTGAFPADSAVFAAAQKEYMKRLWRDSIGFAGAKMIRRIVGIAHVADLESIEDPDIRSNCEKKSIVLAKRLILASASASASVYRTDSGGAIDSWKDVAEAAQFLYDGPAPVEYL